MNYIIHPVCNIESTVFFATQLFFCVAQNHYYYDCRGQIVIVTLINEKNHVKNTISYFKKIHLVIENSSALCL